MRCLTIIWYKVKLTLVWAFLRLANLVIWSSFVGQIWFLYPDFLWS